MMSMKRFLTSIFFIILFASCEKTEEGSSLVGKWKLVATLNDPGNGSGEWLPATQYATIKLSKDGSVKTRNLSEFKKYEVIDSVTIKFTSPNDSTINYKYSLKGGGLELKPPCIEPCGLRFLRID
jgi:hypothetical protein